MSEKNKSFRTFLINTFCIVIVILNQNYTIAQKFDTQESLISLRLKQISNEIEFKYDKIILDKIRTEIHSKETAELLGRFLEIKDFLETEISNRNLPAELICLPIAISQLNPFYFNNLNQSGIWGLNPPVSIFYGLNIDKSIDERYNFYKSTIAALDYFQNIYEQTQDYWLSILIFANSKASIKNIENQMPSTENYWLIHKKNLLPNSEIIPNFIFANYLINFYDDHNIKPIIYPNPEIIEIEITDLIVIDKLLEKLNLNKETFRKLNPTFVSNLMLPNQDYNLVLPILLNDKTLNPEDTLLLQSIFEKEQIENKVEIAVKSNPIYYTVRSGDNLGKIASRNNLSVDDLKKLNNLKSDIIRPGQRLIVSKEHARPISPVSQNPARINSEKEEYVYYTVKSGDTLWNIAQKYPGVSDSDIKRLNNIGNNIQPGQKLKIKKK